MIEFTISALKKMAILKTDSLKERTRIIGKAVKQEMTEFKALLEQIIKAQKLQYRRMRTPYKYKNITDIPLISTCH